MFIDKHYQARALDDMVIAVQSDEVEWESHLSCNGKAIVWNLRNPLRSMLSATVHHLSGLLPMHLAYDDAHGKVSQDWLWSVGCSPLSHTASRLANFSVRSVPRPRECRVLGPAIGYDAMVGSWRCAVPRTSHLTPPASCPQCRLALVLISASGLCHCGAQASCFRF